MLYILLNNLNKKHCIHFQFRKREWPKRKKYTEAVVQRCSVGKHLRQRLQLYQKKRLCTGLQLQDSGIGTGTAKFPKNPFLQNTSGGCFWIYSSCERSEIWVVMFSSFSKKIVEKFTSFAVISIIVFSL